MHVCAQKLHHIKAAQTPHSRLFQQRYQIIHILFLHSFLYYPRTHPAMLMATTTDTVAMAHPPQMWTQMPPNDQSLKLKPQKPKP